MLRRSQFAFRKVVDHQRFSFTSAAARALSTLLEKDPVFSKVSFADRARLTALSLEQLSTDGKSSSVTLEQLVAQAQADSENKAPHHHDTGNSSSKPEARILLAKHAESLGLPASEFESYRDTIHYHLLAGLPQRELAADVSPVQHRLAVIFKLIRTHGWQQLYSEQQIQTAKREVAESFSREFIDGNFSWSSEQERYLRRRLLIDASLHDPLLVSGDSGGGTPEELCKMAWMLLFDSMKARFPRRPKRQPVPAMVYLHAECRAKLEHLPFLERVAVMLNDSGLKEQLAKASATYGESLSKPIVQRLDNTESAMGVAKSEQRFRQSVFHPWSSVRILEKTKPQHHGATPTTANSAEESLSSTPKLHEDAWSLWLRRQSELDQSSSLGDELDPYSTVLKAVTGGDRGVPLPSSRRLTAQQIAALDREAEEAMRQAEQREGRVAEALGVMYGRDAGGVSPPSMRTQDQQQKLQHQQKQQELMGEGDQQQKEQKQQMGDDKPVVRQAAVAPGVSQRLMRHVIRAMSLVSAEECRDPTQVSSSLLRQVEKAMDTVDTAELLPVMGDLGPQLERTVEQAVQRAYAALHRRKKRVSKSKSKKTKRVHPPVVAASTAKSSASSPSLSPKRKTKLSFKNSRRSFPLWIF